MAYPPVNGGIVANFGGHVNPPVLPCSLPRDMIQWAHRNRFPKRRFLPAMFFLPLLLLSLLLWVLWGNRTLLIHEIPLSLPGTPPCLRRHADRPGLRPAQRILRKREPPPPAGPLPGQAPPHCADRRPGGFQAHQPAPGPLPLPHGPPNLPPLTSSRATTRPGCLNILPSNPG